jgi:hypothetical protein
MPEIYQSIAKTLRELTQMHEQAMAHAQAWGLNGFKRKYRYVAKKFHCAELELSNCSFDRYQTKLLITAGSTNYAPTNIREHLSQWNTRIAQLIESLGELNAKHFDVCGLQNGIVTDVLEALLHDLEKTRRYIKRFEETQWSAHDIHVLDDNLHAKYKELEG